MKKSLTALVISGAMLFAGSAIAQDEDFAPREGFRRGGDRPKMERGERRGPGMMGPGMMTMKDPRVIAEEELAKKAPEAYAELVKERKALEAKFQELAAKNEVKLPMSAETRREKMAEFSKKYEKELKEIEELRKTDFRASMEKMQALLKAEGLDMPMPPMMGGRPGPKDDAVPARRRGGGDIEKLKKAYPEEFAKAEQLMKEGKHKEARELMRSLHEKMKALSEEAKAE